MFEAKCPSCAATYQVDERRVPPKGLKMRCPKCGESFQVTAPGDSSPPVLGAALGLGAGPTDPPPRQPPRHKATMLGVPHQASGPAPAGGGAGDRSAGGAPPRPGTAPRVPKATMLGVAPASAGDGLELANLDDEEPAELDDDELDLSSGSPRGADPASDAAALGSRGAEIDLPSIAPDDEEPEELDPDELDLASASHEELPDLPAVGGQRGGSDADLPAVGGPAHSIPGLPELPREDAALPSPTRGRDQDLPDLSLDDFGAELPDVAGDLPDLDPGLPTVGSALPSPSGSRTLGGPTAPEPPAPPSQDWGDSEADFDLGSAHTSMESPDSGGQEEDPFGMGPTTSPKTIPPGRPEQSSADYGQVDFDSVDDEGEFDAFPTDDAGGGAESAVGGGDSYGDVTLEGGDDDLDLGADVDRPAAGTGPRGPTAAAFAAVERPEPRTPGDEAKRKGKGKTKTKKKKGQTSSLSKGTRLALAAALVVTVGGGALASLLPDVGPYGAYFIIDQFKADEYATHLARDIADAQRRLGQDTSREVELAFKEVERGLAQAPRYKARAAYAAYLGFYHQLRFGVASDESARAQALLASLAEIDPATPHLSLARLAQGAAAGRVDPTLLTTRLLGRGTDHAALVGLVALDKGDAELSAKAWQAVLDGQKSTRAHYGLGLALIASGQPDDARRHFEAALELNPAHAGAQIELARLDLETREQDEEILKVLAPFAEGKGGASKGERVTALVLLGELHLQRSRLKKAEESFKAALALAAGSAAAQRGLAAVLFESGRYSEALARYESALSADRRSLGAHLGVVRCKLRLEQYEDAAKKLDKLVEEHPESPRVHYWVGKAKEAIGDKDVAQKAYEKAIELGKKDETAPPELVRAYVSLTRLLGQKGLLDAANEIISQAQKRFPADPTVFEALGELAASRGSFDDAVSDYDRAIELDPNNIGLHFARGIALRQARRFEEAAAEFDWVEKESADYPGLSLERGNLFEESGRSEEALAAYEAALAEAPDDLDLKLRVACARASAGQAKPALDLLKPVLEARPGSAEVNFCQGLAMLNGGISLPDARRYLERAVARDPSRAKHHLYVGWVALEMGDLPTARVSLNKSIELDQTLADAYWKRGELRVKQRAVKDALVDLDRALELAPSRVEAHAQKAVAYLELGKEQDAMAEFQLAVESGVVEPFWHYRYGDLLLVNKRPGDAQKQLTIAVQKGELDEDPPIWLPDAHRLLATAMGRRKEALPHWNAFITARKGTNDPYLGEALREANKILDMIGQ